MSEVRIREIKNGYIVSYPSEMIDDSAIGIRERHFGDEESASAFVHRLFTVGIDY